MKKFIILAMSLCSMAAFAQTEVKKEIKKEVKIENTDGKYQVTIITTENGETKTVTKTYNNLEEMKSDPAMEEMQVITLDKKGQSGFFFSDDAEGEEQEIKVIIGQEEGDEVHEKSHQSFIFKSGEGDNTESHSLKVWVDEDGKKHISKDGVEIDGDTWTSEDGTTYDINKSDTKVIFFSDDGVREFITGDGKQIDVKVKIDEESGESGDEVIIIKTMTDDHTNVDKDVKKMVVRMVEEISLHLEEIDEDDFKGFPGIDAKAIKLDELSYFPNPSSGKFTLAFEANNKPTEIKIISINGKEVYSEILNSFEGTYKKEIDLSGQEPGVYLLQILQGKKATNKKIVIE